MNRLAVSFVLMLCLLGKTNVLGGPIPNDAMRDAKTFEDFLVAQENYSEEQRGDNKNLKQRTQARNLAGNEIEEIGPKLASEYEGKAGFYHGVASGSPLPNAVIVW